MICFDGINSVIESTYLEDFMSNRPGACNVFICPESIKYMMGKTVIINTTTYPAENIRTLIKNGCHVISRVNYGVDGVEVQPYIYRINMRVMWNGNNVLNPPADLRKVLEDDLCTFDIDSGILYFPKINMLGRESELMDEYGNLSSMGWVLQQVGINVKTDTPFCDLDLIKTGKFCG